MRFFLIPWVRLFCFGIMIFLTGNQLIAQTTLLTSDNTKTISISVKTISIPVDYDDFDSAFQRVKKVHLQKGNVLVVNFDDVASWFQDTDNCSLLTSKICYGDNSIQGYCNYAFDWAPYCIYMSSHTIGDGETFCYTPTNFPGTAYIYFYLSEKDDGFPTLNKWLNTCIEVNVD